jgi:hypothetical protein
MTVDPVIALAQRQRLEEAEKAEHALAQQVVAAIGFSMPAPPHGYENFNHWAKRCGVRSLPAKPTTVAFFVLDLYRNGVSFDELAQQLAAISAVHDFTLLANPVRTAIVAAALEAIAPEDAIKAPLSWRKDEKADWHTLPSWAQAVISRREQEREKQLSRRLKELAEQRKANEVQKGSADRNDGGAGAAEDISEPGTGSEAEAAGAVA